MEFRYAQDKYDICDKNWQYSQNKNIFDKIIQYSEVIFDIW